MERIIFFSVIISCLAVHALVAQSRNGAFTPVQGTAERRAIINEFRSAYYQPHKGKLRFKVIYLKVHGSWAWLYAEPMSNGVDAFGETYGSLLHKTKGKWKLMDLPEFVEDPNDPEKLEYPNAADVKEIQRLYPAIPIDIFPAKLRRITKPPHRTRAWSGLAGQILLG
jgi:hypothetical protein